MIKVHPQYIVDENQHRTRMLLSLAEGEKILDFLKNSIDIHAYDEVKFGFHEPILFE